MLLHKTCVFFLSALLLGVEREANEKHVPTALHFSRRKFEESPGQITGHGVGVARPPVGGMPRPWVLSQVTP